MKSLRIISGLAMTAMLTFAPGAYAQGMTVGGHSFTAEQMAAVKTRCEELNANGVAGGNTQNNGKAGASNGVSAGGGANSDAAPEGLGTLTLSDCQTSGILK
ncbi:MAG TPA: hypothetical protein VGM83_16645 [Devosiaceae bacterium]|jgi:hypothetical protein